MSTLSSHLNATQQDEVLVALAAFAVKSGVPLLVTESFLMGKAMSRYLPILRAV